MRYVHQDYTVCDNCVVQPWLNDLSLKQQTVLLSALRGCDSMDKNDISKKFVRVFRSIVLQNAAPYDDNVKRHFCKDNLTQKDVKEFTGSPDKYPMHWLLHFIHAVEIIGYKYPIPETALWWRQLYCKLVNALHMMPETERQMDWRLRDGFVRDCWK